MRNYYSSFNGRSSANTMSLVSFRNQRGPFDVRWVSGRYQVVSAVTGRVMPYTEVGYNFRRDCKHQFRWVNSNGFRVLRLENVYDTPFYPSYSRPRYSRYSRYNRYYR